MENSRNLLGVYNTIKKHRALSSGENNIIITSPDLILLFTENAKLAYLTL